MGFDADERGAKKRDYWFTVIFTDPLAVPISNLLARRTPVTPNQVTVLALFLGLAVGVLFATGERWGFISGGVAFYLAFLFDCVDGKLARATGKSSPRGRALDALADAGRRASALLGLAWAAWGHSGLSDGSESMVRLLRVEPSIDLSLWLVVLYGVLAYFFLEISGAEKSEPRHGIGGRWSAALARRRLLPNPGMPDVQAVVFIAGPLTGYVREALYFGIAMVVAGILLTIGRRLRS